MKYNENEKQNNLMKSKMRSECICFGYWLLD